MIHQRSGEQLSAAELYALLRLRSEVFVVEQQCVYLDLDGRDLCGSTLHLWQVESSQVLGCVRILDADGLNPTIGRVVTAPNARGSGIARTLLDHAVGLCRSSSEITLHAQSHLEDWYGISGFRRVGEPYLEDGIEHVPMQRHI